MIVNSSQGGGSKDTWVLADGLDERGAPRIFDPLDPPAARPAPGPLAPAAAPAAAGGRLMLARIAHEVYWLGRHLGRAEHTARMLDGLFHAALEGRPDDPSGVRLSWDSLLAIMGSRRWPPRGARRRATRRSRSLTLDPENVRSGPLRRAGAGGRANGARHDLRRDVGVGQHVQPGLGRPAGLGLEPARTRSSLREGAHRAVLGADRTHDAEGRGTRVPGGGRPARGGRHGAAHAARGAAPAARGGATRTSRRRRATARRSRCCRP